MSNRSIILFILLLGSVLPLWWLNKKLQIWLRPRTSLGRLMAYLMVMLALVFGFTFLLVWIITQLFRPA